MTYINPEEVFANLERSRRDGYLSLMVTKSPVKYQSSATHPGYLERVDKNDNVTVGNWTDEKFIPLSD